MPLNWRDCAAAGSAGAAECRETLPCVCRVVGVVMNAHFENRSAAFMGAQSDGRGVIEAQRIHIDINFIEKK